VAKAEEAAQKSKDKEKADAQQKLKDKAAADKAAIDKVASDRVAAEKAAADQQRAAAEKAARATTDKADADRIAAETAAAEKAAVEKAVLAKAATPAAAPKPAPEVPRTKITASMGAAERLAIREEEAARKAAEARGIPLPVEPAAKGASGEQLASVSPTLVDPAAPGGAPAGPTISLYDQGKAAESSGNIKAAVRLYVRAVRAGQYEAAKALGDIFADGKGDVPKDYGESLKYYSIAEKNGIKLERSSDRAREYPPVAAPPPTASAPTPRAIEPPAPAPAAPERATVGEPSIDRSIPDSNGVWIVLALSAGLAIGFLLWRRGPRISVPSVPKPSPLASSPIGTPAVLFVSYSHRDKQAVEPLVAQIEHMGRQVWIDRTGITGQAGWAGQIVRAIRECKAVVLMASPNSYASDQVVRELYLAMNHKKPIVPIELMSAELPDELQYILAPFQHHRLSSGDTTAVLGRALAAI